MVYWYGDVRPMAYWYVDVGYRSTHDAMAVAMPCGGSIGAPTREFRLQITLIFHIKCQKLA